MLGWKATYDVRKKVLLKSVNCWLLCGRDKRVEIFLESGISEFKTAYFLLLSGGRDVFESIFLGLGKSVIVYL